MAAFVRVPDGQSRLCSFHAHIMAVAHESGQCRVLGLRRHFAHAPGMELRQLRYLVAVAETGNISRAAQKIFLTQPALTRQIKALEDELGQCLLERQAHSIRKTPSPEARLRDDALLLARPD